VKGTVVQQWICDAVVPVVKPLNDTSTNNVFKTSSVVTVAKPVAGDVFGGDSPGPVRLAAYVIVVAWLDEIESMSAAIMTNANEEMGALSIMIFLRRHWKLTATEGKYQI
jgi:hypothetical protein